MTTPTCCLHARGKDIFESSGLGVLAFQLGTSGEQDRCRTSRRALGSSVVQFETEAMLSLVWLVDTSPASFEGVQVTDLELGIAAATVDRIKSELFSGLLIHMRYWTAGGFVCHGLGLRCEVG